MLYTFLFGDMGIFFFIWRNPKKQAVSCQYTISFMCYVFNEPLMSNNIFRKADNISWIIDRLLSIETVMNTSPLYTLYVIAKQRSDMVRHITWHICPLSRD